jgi:hypothetical protein
MSDSPTPSTRTDEPPADPQGSPRWIVVGAWLMAGAAIAGLLDTAPDTAGGWWRLGVFVTVTFAAWVGAGSSRMPWLLPVAVVIDGLLASLPLYGAVSAGMIPGPAWLSVLAAAPGLVRGWRWGATPTVGMLASGAIVGGGSLVLAIAHVDLPLAPAWGSSWLALVLPLVVAAAGLKRGSAVVAVLVSELFVSTLLGTLATPYAGSPLLTADLPFLGGLVVANVTAIAAVLLIAAGIDHSLPAEPPGLGLLVALNAVNVIDAVSTWLLLARGDALEFNPLMDHPAALVAKVIGVAVASVWLRRHRPLALIIPLVPLAWVTLYHVAGWLRWSG